MAVALRPALERARAQEEGAPAAVPGGGRGDAGGGAAAARGHGSCSAAGEAANIRRVST